MGGSHPAAVVDSSEVERLRKHPARIYVATTVGMFAVASFVAFISDFGENVDTAFYAGTAQIIPVLFIALLLEVALRFSPLRELAEKITILKQGDEQLASLLQERQTLVRQAIRDGHPVPPLVDAPESSKPVMDIARELYEEGSRQGRWIVMAYGVAAFPGETAALMALATGESGTFHTMLVIESVVLLPMLLYYNIMRRSL